MSAAVDEMTHAEFLATLRERFGESPADWAFVCPSCGDVSTGADHKAALTAAESDRNAATTLGQECIGRLTGALSRTPVEHRGCDWCAFGLIRGPLRVTMADGSHAYSFRIAEAAR